MAGQAELDVGGMIAHLEEQRAALDTAIEALKRLADVRGNVTGLQGLRSPKNPQEIQPDVFVGMNIAEAAEKYLGLVGRPARTTEAIVDALLRGGLQRVSPASVATILIRIHNRPNGPIVRVQKGLWGLAEWYPKRPPRATRRERNGSDSEESESVARKPRRPPKPKAKGEENARRPRPSRKQGVTAEAE